MDRVSDRLARRLQAAGVAFVVTEHEPVHTSEAAAKVRGAPLSSGAKALICRVDDRFVLLVLPADRRLSSAAVKRVLRVRRLRFATRDELLALTGLEPGAIPPFGSLFSLETWCDEGIAHGSNINFNAGDHTISIAMRSEDYLRIEQPSLAPISER